MDPILEYETEVTSRMLDEWRCYINAFPLPPHLTPRGGAPLSTVSDEALLNCPPHLISHIQRTAAQGGLQIVSPRQTPITHMMVRKGGDIREIGDHDVGSIADPNAEWPTIDGANMDMLLPDEPLAPLGYEDIARPKTVVTGLVKPDLELADPVLMCLIKGRAVVDILRREDVAGGGDAMAELLAHAWSIPVSDLMELEAYTVGVDGPMQRHAMKVDEVYPTIYAPVQFRSVISVGNSDMDKENLPADTGVDWRRARIYCESVFYNSCVIEGLPIKKMAGVVKPGDPSSRPNKRGTLTFSPAPGIAWTHHPGTFSIYPGPYDNNRRAFQIPPDVRLALQSYLERVRPISYLLAGGKKLDTMQSVARDLGNLKGETLANAYHVALRSMTTGSSRGRIAASTVRNAIYNIIEGAPVSIRLRIARYLLIARKECAIYLGKSEIPDEVIDDIASRFSALGTLMRAEVAAEATRRNTTISEWWIDILSQAPARFWNMTEGNVGWATVAMWLAMKEPNEKWAKLKSAVKWNSMRAAAKDSVGGVKLPAGIGTAERLVAGCRQAVTEISKSFAGYYQGAADVSLAIGKAAERMKMARTAEVLREAGYLWSLRARSLRAVNVHPVAKDEPTPSMNHYRVFAVPVDLILKPAPYMPYHAWRTHINKSDVIARGVKKYFENCRGPVISKYFLELERPILACKESICTKYLVNPAKLGADMERAWGMLVEDVREVAERFEVETREMERRQAGLATVNAPQDNYTDLSELVEDALVAPAKGVGIEAGLSYFDILGNLDFDIVEGLEDTIASLPTYMQEEIFSGRFSDVGDLMKMIDARETEHMSKSKRTSDLVK